MASAGGLEEGVLKFQKSKSDGSAHQDGPSSVESRSSSARDAGLISTRFEDHSGISEVEPPF